MTVTSMRSLIALAIAMSCSVHAADAVRAGSYENPNGDLVITGTADSLKFKIDAFGANGHTCSLDGDIHDNQAKLEGDESPCIVKFKASAKGIDVSSNDACRTYCGMRAHFDGMYFTPAPGCAGDDRAQTRRRLAGDAAYRIQAGESRRQRLRGFESQVARG